MDIAYSAVVEALVEAGNVNPYDVAEFGLVCADCGKPLRKVETTRFGIVLLQSFVHSPEDLDADHNCARRIRERGLAAGEGRVSAKVLDVVMHAFRDAAAVRLGGKNGDRGMIKRRVNAVAAGKSFAKFVPHVASALGRLDVAHVAKASADGARPTASVFARGVAKEFVAGLAARLIEQPAVLAFAIAAVAVLEHDDFETRRRRAEISGADVEETADGIVAEATAALAGSTVGFPALFQRASERLKAIEGQGANLESRVTANLVAGLFGLLAELPYVTVLRTVTGHRHVAAA